MGDTFVTGNRFAVSVCRACGGELRKPQPGDILVSQYLAIIMLVRAWRLPLYEFENVFRFCILQDSMSLFIEQTEFLTLPAAMRVCAPAGFPSRD